MIDRLIRDGVLIPGDAEVMALEFFAPISMELYRCDRQPECEDAAMAMVEAHIRTFFRVFSADRDK